jgi:hypothetical protein
MVVCNQIKASYLGWEKTMHEYQKRSNSSPKIAAAQAYKRKVAAKEASSSANNQAQMSPKIDRERMAKLHGMMMGKLMQMQAAGQQTDGEATLTQAYAETEEVGQEVQAKGDWQQKADTNAIFSNGSALPPAVMAKYENLMPGVSLEHVSLHQGREVDAALGAAKLHGLTDGTNIAVSSKAPQGTLEHEIGHVGQRQEKDFSLNEVNRQAHEADADNISAKLLSDQPVERFGQEKQAAKEAPDGDSANGEHQSSPAHSIDRNITAKQSGVMMGKLTQEESPAGEMLDRQQEFDRTEASGTEEEASAEKRSTQSDKNADRKVKDDANLAQHTNFGDMFPPPSPLPAGRTNPQAIIGIHVFIQLVQKAEKVYGFLDSPKQTVTRIRNLYYSSASPGFAGLLPNAPNYELRPEGAGEVKGIPILPPNPFALVKLRVVRRENLSEETYKRLTAQANENTVRGQPPGDNPSPYILLQNGKLVDVGHLLLTLDALLHPGSTRPYTDYGVPTIDAASWVADIGIASVWATTHNLKTGKPNSQAPPGMKLSDPPTNSQLDEYYKASAPESDLLGNVDGFGLFHNWNSKQPLSEALRDYYVETQEKPAGVNKRWLTFCRLNRFVTLQGNQVKWRERAELLKELIPRVNNFCNLFAAGRAGSIRTIREGWLNNQKWEYIPYMLNKFLDYVATNLKAELGSKV